MYSIIAIVIIIVIYRKNARKGQQVPSSDTSTDPYQAARLSVLACAAYPELNQQTYLNQRMA